MLLRNLNFNYLKFSQASRSRNDGQQASGSVGAFADPGGAPPVLQMADFSAGRGMHQKIAKKEHPSWGGPSTSDNSDPIAAAQAAWNNPFYSTPTPPSPNSLGATAVTSTPIPVPGAAANAKTDSGSDADDVATINTVVTTMKSKVKGKFFATPPKATDPSKGATSKVAPNLKAATKAPKKAAKNPVMAKIDSFLSTDKERRDARAKRRAEVKEETDAIWQGGSLLKF